MTPLLTRKRQIQVKTEAVKGTAETSGLSDVLCFDFSCPGPSIFTGRQGSGASLGHQVAGTTDGPRIATCTLTTELRITSAPVLVAGLDALIGACGVKLSTATYSPTSSHTTQETCTIRFFEDGRLKVLRGCMGNCTLTANAGERVMLTFEMQGVWVTPTDVALPTPSYGTEKVIKADNDSGQFQIDDVDYRYGSFEFNLGNNVTPLLDAGSTGGVAYMAITNREPTVTVDIEADVVATHPTYTDWLGDVEQELELIVTNGTRTATLNMPKFQIQEIADGDRDGIITDNITGQPNQSAAVDDEWTMVVA